MSEIDDVLRQSFARIAEPGDPAGVADVLRARMAAGDTGTPAATSGFRSTADRVLPWLFGGSLLAIAVVVAALTGLAGGASVPSTRVADVTETSAATPQESATPSASPTPTPTVTDSPTPTAAPIEPPPSAPLPAADTVGPTLSGASVNPDEVFAADADADYCSVVAMVTVTAADNVGVTGVTVSWSGPESGTAEMTLGNGWTFGFNPAQSTPRGTVTFTMVARDAAGNTSAPATASVLVWNSGDCII